MKKFKRWPIAYQLYALAMIIILIISSIFISAYYMISNSLMENNLVYTTQVFKQIQSNLEDKTTLMENLLINTGYNRTVFKYIMETDNSNKLGYLIEMDNTCLNVNQIEKNIQEVIIEGFNGCSYFSNGKTDNVVEALKVVPKEPMNYYNISQNLSYKKNSDLSFILSTSLYDIWNITGHKYTARVSFIVDMDILGIEDFSDEYDMGLFLLDGEYNICAANQDITEDTKEIFYKIQSLQTTERQEIIVNDMTYIINSNYLTSIGATILSITPKTGIINSLLWVKQITYYLLLVALVLIIIMFMLFKHNITSPLNKFSIFMKEIENGDTRALKKQVNLDGYKEIEEISNQFNSMIAEIDSLTHRLVKTMRTLYETELQRKQAELLHLKSQINPHFLFNTLEVIMGIAYEEEAPKTAEMIKCLSKIFKYCVKGKDTVSIQEELNIIMSYMHIQQTRFYELFDAHYEFDENILENQIPKMLLQPIVENAVTHGLEKKGSKGNVYIGGKRSKEGYMKLWVQDDGIGLDEEHLKYLKTIISKETLKRSDCIGFENVINRLQLIYGDKCEIEISSEINKGTRIELIIPVYNKNQIHN